MYVCEDGMAAAADEEAAAEAAAAATAGAAAAGRKGDAATAGNATLSDVSGAIAALQYSQHTWLPTYDCTRGGCEGVGGVGPGLRERWMRVSVCVCVCGGGASGVVFTITKGFARVGGWVGGWWVGGWVGGWGPGRGRGASTG